MAGSAQRTDRAAGLYARLPERRLIDTIPVEVRRSTRRRTRLGLAFDPAGWVIVEAPVDASAAEIRAVIREHRRWLRHRLDKVVDATGLTACLAYTAGELFHYLGGPYELVVQPGRADTVRLRKRRPAGAAQMGLFRTPAVRGQLCVTLGAMEGVQSSVPSSARVRAALTEWYQARAAERFAMELDAWRRELPWLGGRMPPWRHRFMRSQWGSCSRSGRISLNTHLIKAPVRLIEYVVLHELCHLRHYDHGSRFYGLMSRYMPDWQERRGELDQYLPVLMQD
jgi:predicted metal-dependent hydrolase